MKLSGSNQGFTLVEILFTVLILIVIVVLAVPNFKGTYSAMQLTQSAEDLTYMMRYAQSRAISQNQTVRLEFDQDFKKYHLAQGNFSSSDDEQLFDSIPGRLGRAVVIPEELTLETEDQFVYFYPDGSMERQRIYICLNEKCRTVSTREQRGFVQVFEGRLEDGDEEK